MKKNVFCIVALIIAAIASVTIVSCKKDKEIIQNNNNVEAFDPNGIEDMNEYLKDFKLRMQLTAKGNDTELSLEEAAWHLSSLANYDFANANVEFDDVRFDTLFNSVTLTNGRVFITDLSVAYESICNDIDKFYCSMNGYNKHFRFIGVSISETGVVTVPIISTSSKSSKYWGDTLYYFPNQTYAETYCDSIFNNTAPYNANGYGMWELERVLNLIESHPIDPMSCRTFYTFQSEKSFFYRDYIDSFGSPFVDNSRLFATLGYYYDTIPGNDMCYLVDSYAGLGYQYCPVGSVPVYWRIMFVQGGNKAPCVGSHKLFVGYGKLNVAQEQIEY